MKRDKPKYKQIIDAAVIVIAENGYHQAQVSKIAKEAKVADGTIYLYFKNKEDILISVQLAHSSNSPAKKTGVPLVLVQSGLIIVLSVFCNQ